MDSVKTLVMKSFSFHHLFFTQADEVTDDISPLSPMISVSDMTCDLQVEGVSQSMNLLVKQLINQSISQSISQSINQSINIG